MAEMTDEQIIEILESFVEDCYTEECRIAHRKAIQAFKDKEKFSKLLKESEDRYEGQTERNQKLIEENEKLKENLNCAVKQMSDVSFKLGQAKAEIEQLQKQLNNSISAIEVLEWLYRNMDRHEMKDALGTSNINDVFCDLKPQEIIDKITEYERSRIEPPKKETCDKCNKEHCEQDDGKAGCFEEQREFRVEWVYEICHHYHDKLITQWEVNTEEEAIRLCEEFATKQNKGTMTYMKACRKFWR